jgi:hypothetical protein
MEAGVKMNMATIYTTLFFSAEVNNTDIIESKRKKQGNYLKLEYLGISIIITNRMALYTASALQCETCALVQVQETGLNLQYYDPTQ